MSLDADLIVDRRRMRRKLTFWRVVAIAVIVLAGAGSAELWTRRAGFADAGAYIARVTIRGLIRDDDERVQQLERLAQSSTARAVVVHVDSPGGTTAGSEQLYDALMRLKEKKPLVIVVESMAASGAYITALAGDHIVAKQTSLVGSIGVLFQYPNVSDLLDKVGVKVETIKSSPLKAVPNGFEPTSPEARAAVESIIMDSYAWFRGLVQERRHLDGEALGRVADGRVFTGHQGIDLKLVDEIGDERTAVAWLAKEKNIDAKLPVRDYKLHSRFGDLPFLHAAAVAVLDAFGLTTLARSVDELGAVQAIERLNLDGLLALWHPANAN
ncbi:MAG TPA: signal peptide peptidase SppA [Xanthobacteraceae bacterium]|jgi:protease-4|nr:signal peptide peptidase SppA [Xanthobacteraceae bacterium]